jgi:uncharacterized protein DUF2752
VRGRYLDVGFAGLAFAQLAGAAWLVPQGDTVVTPDGGSLGVTCPSHLLFGVDCPLCGMTRSFVALAHGDLDRALHFHPAGPLLFAAMLAFLGAVVVVALRRARPIVERRNFLVAFQAVTLVSLVLGVFKMVRS